MNIDNGLPLMLFLEFLSFIYSRALIDLTQHILLMKQQVVFKDEQLEAMLSKLNLNKVELVCKEGNKIMRACLNPECPISLICGLSQCTRCGGEAHEDCSFVNFDRFSSFLSKRVDSYKQFVKNVFEIQDQFIETLYQGRKQIITPQNCSGDLSEKEQNIIKEVYENKNAEFLNGRDAKEFFEKLKKEKGGFPEHTGNLLESYKVSLEEEMKKMQEVKNELYKKYGNRNIEKQRKAPKRQKVEVKKQVTQSTPAKSYLDESDQAIYDAKIKAMLSSFYFQTFSENLKCIKGNKVGRVCCSPLCHSVPFLCSEEQCQSCSKDHQNCTFMLSDGFFHSLNKRMEQYRSFVSRMCSIENILVDNLHKKEKQLIQKYKFSGFKGNQSLIRQMCSGQNLMYSYQGGSMSEFFGKLHETIKESESKTETVANWYEKNLQYFYNILLNLKENAYKFLNNQGTFSLEKKSYRCRQIVVNFNYLEIEKYAGQSILDTLPQNKIEFIKNSFRKKIKKLKLLFQASEHNYSAKEFHKMCNGIEDTLVLVRFEHRQILAGFTHYRWDKLTEYRYVNDNGRDAFLLQMDQMQKLIPQRDKNLICCDQSYGPNFGEYDLSIGNDCKENCYSSVNLGNTYNTIDGKYRYNNSGTRSVKVEEYEVYKVVFQ